ncbi:MAG: zf-HC2 domain-containing protein [Oscillospiraceae bacterium]|nr:zf-HC2 domain-containing protein [Oscillospiraceae bacterium]
MKINCNIIDDLLPLYIEDACSADSKAAVEEHLSDCPLCQEKLKRMQSVEPAPEVLPEQLTLERCVGKLRRHQLRTAVFVVFSTLLLAVLLLIGYWTAQDMYRTAHPNIYEKEEGVYNLTAADLTTVAEEAKGYLLYTNNMQIAVSVIDEADFNGTVFLWDEQYPSSPIAEVAVNEEQRDAVFTNLTAAARYRISTEGFDDLTLTISEGREVSIWRSLNNVLTELARLWS